MSTNYEELEKLAELKEKGILTEEEFLKKKQEILGRQPVVEKNSEVSRTDKYASLNDHLKKVFTKFDRVVEGAKQTVKIPGVSTLWSWNWAAFFFGPFWFIAKERYVDLIIYIILVIIGIASSLVLSPLAGIYWLGYAFWGDFYEYYKYKTGKKNWWITPKTMMKELMSI